MVRASMRSCVACACCPARVVLRAGETSIIMPESPISNPLAPPSFIPTGGAPEKPLSNADFRKIMMTPRATPARSGGGGGGRGGGGGGRSSGGGGGGAPPSGEAGGEGEDGPISNPIRPVKAKRVHDEDAAARQKARKWQKGKEKEVPAVPKYRDRARERRDGDNPDYEETEAQLAGFHSVPPPSAETMGNSKAELQKISIENSKYLGGDMDHTHLVKGLDFALLAKIKSENTQKEKEDREKAMRGVEEQQAKVQKQSGLPPMKAPTIASAIGVNTKKTNEVAAAPAVQVLTPMGKSILYLVQRSAANLGTNGKHRNEQFLPGRMAFVFDLEDEFPQELPTTLLRSKEDCPKEVNALAGRIDAALLDKVTKVMSFLRQGSKTHKKLKKKDKPNTEDGTKEKEALMKLASRKAVVEDDDIFADAGTDYIVSKPKKEEKQEEKAVSKKEPEPPKDAKRDDKKREEDRRSDRRDERRDDRREDKRDDRRDDRDDTRSRRDDKRDDRKDDKRDDRKRDEKEREDDKEKKAKANYFQTPAESFNDAYSTTDNTAQQALEQAKQLTAKLNPNEPPSQEEKKKVQAKKTKEDQKKDPGFVEDTYSECYPGSYETAMYAYESDEEEDITKMDMGGSKKGKLKRWDFDDEESWNEYNDQREAMPKAAFQFGVKMSDGRKTRRNTKDNKDANKINTILKQRAVDSVQAKKLPDKAEEPKGKRRRVHDDD